MSQVRMRGNKLHNCQRLYAERALAGKCTIAVMTDDEGKLLFVLKWPTEKSGRLNSIKNRPVAKNPELDARVIEWAMEAKLKINTCDIDTGSGKTN